MSMYKSSPNNIETPLEKARRVFNGFLAALGKLDARSWVVLLLAFIVLTGAAVINAWAMSAFFPLWLAVLLSGYAEAGALGWKIADERPINSDAQKQLTLVSVWVNVAAFGVVLVANLIRGVLHSPLSSARAGMNGWDYLVFAVIGVISVWHVAGAILFREWDAGLNNRRILRQQRRQAEFDRMWQETVINGLRASLEMRAEAMREVTQAREKFTGRVSPEELSWLVGEAANKLKLRGVENTAHPPSNSGEAPHENPTSGRMSPPASS